jgi:hypothetical protein
MSIRDLFRRLLCFYPAHFHQEFGEEMCQVFESRAAENRRRGAASIVFALREFTGIVKGAGIMRIAKLLNWHTHSETGPASSFKAPVNVEEANQLRLGAIRKMVACIARGDFERAREYSWEEVRLNRVIREFQGEGSQSI